MSVYWVEYKEKKILYADYRGLEGDGLIQNLYEVFNIIKATPGKVLILDNFQGVYVNSHFMNEAKNMSSPDEDTKVEKSAILGIDPVKALLLNGYNRATGQRLKSFKTEEEAKEWLVEP